MQVLTRQEHLAHASGRIRAPDGSHHQAVVHRPLQHAAGRHRQQPCRRVRVGAGDVPEYVLVDGVKGKRGPAQGQPDRRAREHPLVDRERPDPPLAQQQPWDRRDQRIRGWQQNRDRQSPDGVNIQDQPRVLTGPAGHLYSREAASDQGPEQEQLARPPGEHRKANADGTGVKGSDGHDEHNQPAGINPPDRPRADSQNRAGDALELGNAHVLLRDERSAVRANPPMADLGGVALHCRRWCALFVKYWLLTVSRLAKTSLATARLLRVTTYANSPSSSLNMADHAY